MARMFGTDGVRGIANRDLTCELAYRLGQASAYVLASDVSRPTILVGRDTRISGEMLECALVAGVCSVGARAVLVDVLPTPAIAYLTRIFPIAYRRVAPSCPSRGSAISGVPCHEPTETASVYSPGLSGANVSGNFRPT